MTSVSIEPGALRYSRGGSTAVGEGWIERVKCLRVVQLDEGVIEIVIVVLLEGVAGLETQIQVPYLVRFD